VSERSPRLGAAALWYARRGWYVFPCKPAGKTPLTPHAGYDATADLTVIRRWWERWPDANIAIATGRASGIVVLDVDPGHGGDDSLAALVAEHGQLVETPEVLTGGGGRHLYFRAPPGDEVKNAVGVGGWPGLDLRGEAGYVIAPPSLHPSGNRYAWEASSRPESTPLADMPDWLLALVAERAGADGRKPAEPIPERIRAGERNTTLTSLAGTMRRRGASEAAILAALAAENRLRCEPPLGEEEVKQIGKSVSKYAAGELFRNVPPPAGKIKVRVADLPFPKST
jgi:hypothetical protein